mmetsp:Transcript_400/g.952  ORF Transcript_400/g.952 Transcript_400/m.952 type:complete len:248 (-) Transcript_400:74-817(-)
MPRPSATRRRRGTRTIRLRTARRSRLPRPTPRASRRLQKASGRKPRARAPSCKWGSTRSVRARSSWSRPSSQLPASCEGRRRRRFCSCGTSAPSTKRRRRRRRRGRRGTPQSMTRMSKARGTRGQCDNTRPSEATWWSWARTWLGAIPSSRASAPWWKASSTPRGARTTGCCRARRLVRRRRGRWRMLSRASLRSTRTAQSHPSTQRSRRRPPSGGGQRRVREGAAWLRLLDRWPRWTRSSSPARRR